MTTTEDTTASSSRDFSSKSPQRPRRKSRRRGGGDENRGNGSKASQWDPSSNMPDIDESIPSINISELQLQSRNSLIEIAEKHGFTLISKSEINSNPNDTKDYEKGVWTLPPVYRLKERDKEKYLNIGESDRMTLLFKKL